MYLPDHFRETSSEVIERIVNDFPLATLIAQSSSGLTVNHIPLLLKGTTTLIGHVALANDLHRELIDGTEVLCVFQGADGYVSPNWYPSKAEHHRHVPTWNYDVVHIAGQITWKHDTKTKRAVVGRLTQHFERDTNGEQAWRMADAPADYMSQMLDAIVAFDIEINGISAKAKMSQNREWSDASNVAEAFDKAQSKGMARRMRDVLERRST